MGKEVLACHIAESGHPVTGVGSVRTIVGHEVTVEEVVDTPHESIVDEGVRGLSGAEDTNGTGILAVVGATHPSLAETL